MIAPVDLHDPATFDAGIPQPAFAELRRTPGLVRSPPAAGDRTGFWSVTRHADVVAVSRDPRTYSSAVGHIQIYDIDEDALDARASMIDLDPPIHTRLRRLVSAAFTPRHVQGYAEAIAHRVAAALDALEAEGGGDWVETVAAPIPIGVICDIMGVPEADHRYMIELSDHLVAGTSSEPLPADAYGNTTDLRLLPFNSPAATGINTYARKLGERRRDRPTDDLVSKLIQAEVDADDGQGPTRLTDAEFTNFFRLMIFAGNETTRSSMAHLALHLVDFADEFERLRGQQRRDGTLDPVLVNGAVEEVLRYSSPILYFRRTATVDAELSGTPVAAGDKLVMWYAAANFDESVFPDPLRFSFDRPNPPTNLAFGGGGAHFCLGASLARLELSALITEIIRRDLTLELCGRPTYVDSNFVNGIEHLAVAVSRRL
ncbi:MAG: cytochrome P450 [Actinomycetota bacterium]